MIGSNEIDNNVKVVKRQHVMLLISGKVRGLLTSEIKESYKGISKGTKQNDGL